MKEGWHFSRWRRRRFWLVGLVGGLVIMGWLMRWGVSAPPKRGGAIVPYTVVLRETIHRSDGTRTVVAEQLRAVRSDGSQVVQLRHMGRREVSERVIHFASGLRVATNEGARTKSTVMRRGVPPGRWLRDPAAQCVGSLAGGPFTEPPEVVQGEEMVAGFRTVKITDGIFTEWLALDYGCAVVRSRADWGSEGYSQWDVVVFVPGEPDEGLFAVAGYREVPPSERVLGGGEGRRSVDAQMMERLRRADAYYYAHRPEPQQ